MTRQDIQERLAAIASEEFDILKAQVTMDLSAGSIDTWDSFGHLQLFMAVENAWKIKFTTEQIVQLSSLRAIADAIEAKLNQ